MLVHISTEPTTEKTAEDFPSLCEPCDRSYWPEDPWGHISESTAWLEANFDKYFYRPSEIISRFQKYEGVRPGPNKCGVYFLGLAGDIGYVGKATSICERIWSHRMDKNKPFTHYWCITNIPKPVIDDIEGFYIKWLRPPLNGAIGRPRDFLWDKAQELLASDPWPPNEWPSENQWPDGH